MYEGMCKLKMIPVGVTMCVCMCVCVCVHARMCACVGAHVCVVLLTLIYMINIWSL